MEIEDILKFDAALSTLFYESLQTSNNPNHTINHTQNTHAEHKFWRQKIGVYSKAINYKVF